MYSYLNDILTLESKNDPYFIERKNKIISLVKGENVLDVGCGTGFICNALAEKGYNVVGIDISEKAEKISKTKNNRFVFLREDINNPSKKLRSQKFDTIILSDVIEHIENEDEILGNCRNLLKDNGQVILTVPAFDFLRSRLDNEAGHCRRYSKKKLRAVLEKNDYKVDVLRYYYGMALLIQFVIAKMNKNPLRIYARLFNSPLRVIMVAILKPLFFIDKIIPLPIGPSLITRASKV